MPDREKVIKGLEELYGFLFREYANIPAEESKIYYERTCAIRDAIFLLKEQDAKNVVDMRLSKDWFRIASCPRCNELLNWVYHRKNCGYCGQAVKWE